MGILSKIIREWEKPINNKINGIVGEKKVSAQLNPLLFGRVNHRQINNLVLLDDNGKSHQIDHIEIRENGIFCIETKNYKGWIFGSENQEKWTQTLYNKEKHSFLNPLKQNKSHIYYVSRVLEGKYKINSLVVFAQNNADRIECPNVINLSNLKAYLKNFNDGTKLTDIEMDEIHQKLLEASIDMSNREHVANIRKTQKELKEGICPRCGSKLVERHGKYGPFIGCSNYPSCKFILKNK